MGITLKFTETNVFDKNGLSAYSLHIRILSNLKLDKIGLFAYSWSIRILSHLKLIFYYAWA